MKRMPYNRVAHKMHANGKTLERCKSPLLNCQDQKRSSYHLWQQRIERGKKIADQIDAGMVFINHPTWTQADHPLVEQNDQVLVVNFRNWEYKSLSIKNSFG